MAAIEKRLRDEIALLLSEEIADVDASHDEIAARAGISRQLLSRIVNGRGNPRINGIARAFAAFGKELFVEPTPTALRVGMLKANKAKRK
jgi:DNA-binding phage protein